MPTSVRQVSAYLLLAFAAVFGVNRAAADEAADKKEAATRDFNASAALQNSGLHELAARRWQEFIAKYPTDERLDRVHYYLAVAYLKNDKLPEAKAAFEAVIAKYPAFAQRDQAQFNLGFTLYFIAEKSKKPEDYRAAAEKLAAVPAQFPNSTVRDRALFYQASALYLAGDAKSATAIYERIATEFPSSTLLPETLFALGALQEQQQDPAKAAATFQKFLANPAYAQHDRASEVRLRLGLALYQQGQFEPAREQFAQLAGAKDNPLADRATLELGRSLIELNRAAEAQAKLQEGLQKFPSSPHKPALQYVLALALYRQQKWDEARPQLEPLLGQDPALATAAAQLLAQTLDQQKKPQEALQQLEAAIARHPQHERAPALELDRLQLLRRFPERRKELPALYKQYLDKYPQHALQPAARAGYALESLNQRDLATARTSAEAFLADAKLQSHSAWPTALFVAAEANFLALESNQPGGDAARAEQYYRQLVEKHPDFALVDEAHVRIGQGYLRDKRWDDCRNYLAANYAKLKQPASKAAAQLAIGRAHAAQQRWPEAQAAFQNAHDADAQGPRADESLLWLADTLRAQNKPAEADQRLEQLLARFATSAFRPQALVQRGELALVQQKYDDALARYRELLEKHSGDPLKPTAQYGLAAAYYAKNDDNNAVQTLNQLFAAEVKDAALAAQGRYLRALALERQKQFELAAQDYQTFLNAKPTGDDESKARLALARCRVALNQPQPAADVLAALVKERPQFTALDQAYYELGHARLLLKQASEAHEAFRALTEKFAASPLAPEAWFHVGRFHEDAAAQADVGQKSAALERAAASYQQGADKAPAGDLKAQLRFKQADARYRAGQFDAGAQTFEQFLREHATHALAGAARFLCGECYFQQQKFDQALPLLVKTADDKLEPYHALALYRAGACEAQRKQWVESQKHFSNLLSAFPQYPHKSEARYGVGAALFQQNKYAEARPVLAAVAAETDAEPAAKARFLLGEIAFAEKKFADAIEQFLIVSEGYAFAEWQGLARFETARAFVELGDKPQAIKTLETLLTKQPQHAKANDAKALLAELKK